MSLIDQLIGVMAPHNCLGCDAEGDLICSACLRGLPAVPERCYRCRRASAGGLTCLACRQTSQLIRVRVGTTYEKVAKDLIWKLKLAGTQVAAQRMATRLRNLVSDQSAIIVPVPTATSRSRQRGYDQAKLLARALSRQTGMVYMDTLARLTQSHQHGLPRAQRLTQLTNAFRVTRPASLRSAHIILVDDVITTGATLEAAAAILRKAGAGVVEALVFAQP